MPELPTVALDRVRRVLRLAAVAALLPAAAARADIVQQVSRDGQIATMRLRLVPLRGPPFGVRIQRADGSYQPIAAPPERAYLGRVDEFPGALASGVMMGDGTLWGEIVFDRGATWFTRGSNVTGTRGLSPATFVYPTLPNVAPGRIGPSTYRWELGLDLAGDWYARDAGSSPARALELAEYSVSNLRAIYLQDAQLMPAIGRVVIRAAVAHDPYASLNTDAERLTAVKSEWLDFQPDAGVDSATLVHHTGGGLAYVSHFGPTGNFSVVGSSDDGTFDVVARHELGHNWGALDNHAGQPEGQTVMDGNQYARFSGPELEAILLSRDNHLGILDSLGTFDGAPVPPYAALDLAQSSAGAAARSIPVLGNDHDANGQPVHLAKTDKRSSAGGTVHTRAGRAVYLPPVSGSATLDHFSYLVADAGGQTATGVVLVRLAQGRHAIVLRTCAGGRCATRRYQRVARFASFGAARAALRRRGRTVARGLLSTTSGRQLLTLRAGRHLPSGSYRLVLTHGHRRRASTIRI